jgi:dTDP-3-amino-3,4,6-trideoxy-alpha-D-glucose transaminase
MLQRTDPVEPTPVRRVPFVDLHAQHAPLRAELRAAFERVVDGSGYILGAEVEAFEAEWAEYCGVKHAVGVASGTAALTLALQAAGIGPGDEVVVPAHTFIASALGVVHAGATPVLCDVDDERGLIDPASAAAAISPRTAAIVAVHLYGQVCDMGALTDLGRRHGLLVLEDAAQAHGAALAGGRAGSLGAMAAFSFYPSKNLGALGDGGAVCTDDDELAARVRRLRNLGQRAKSEHVETGYNERLDGLQAALLRVKLPHLDAWNDHRRALAGRYRDTLRSLPVLPDRDDAHDVYHLFAVRVPDREAWRQDLGAAGIDTGVHYSPSLAEQPPIADTALQPVPLDSSRAWARDELSLPMSAELDASDVERVAEACEQLVHRHGGDPR